VAWPLSGISGNSAPQSIKHWQSVLGKQEKLWPLPGEIGNKTPFIKWMSMHFNERKKVLTEEMLDAGRCESESGLCYLA